MLYINNNGIKIPKLGFGTWQLEGKGCEASVTKAIEIGYRHIDTAQKYGNETEVGTGIKNSGVKREDIFLTTKVWVSELQNVKMQKSVDESLKKLKTEYVDLLLIHWPNEELSPISEQLKILDEIKKLGKAKLIGVSNYTIAQMKLAVEDLGINIATNQVEYHPYLSQEKVLGYMRNHGMFLTAYSPLARGKAMTDAEILRIAEKYDKSAGQIVLRWHMQQNDVAAIPKASSEKNIRGNFEIFDFELSAEDMDKINSCADADGRIIDPAFAPAWDN